MTRDASFKRENSLSAREMNSVSYFAVAEKAQIPPLYLDLHIIKICKKKRS